MIPKERERENVETIKISFLKTTNDQYCQNFPALGCQILTWSMPILTNYSFIGVGEGKQLPQKYFLYLVFEITTVIFLLLILNEEIILVRFSFIIMNAFFE